MAYVKKAIANNDSNTVNSHWSPLLHIDANNSKNGIGWRFT